MNKKIKRRLFNSLLEHLSNPEISLIIGPRQAGKTTLMRRVQEHLIKAGEKCLFLNLDFETDHQYFVSQNALIKRMRLEFGETRGYVFIDEIQRKENAGLFLKGIYDQNLSYKLIVSGSGSVELKEKVHESLAGRKRIFALSTISFPEFADFKTDYQYSDRLADFFSADEVRAGHWLDEYLDYGGYPKVVLADTGQDKLSEINEIYRSYIEKDLAYLLKIEKLEAFGELIKILSAQVGQLVNYSELSNTLGLSLPTVKNYLWYAEKTFILEKLTPFFRNLRKEITKAPVYYFYDLGLRNFSAGKFGALNNLEKGFAFQNLVFQVLKEKLFLQNAAIHFWRTADKTEVDFVITRGNEIIPVEVKYQIFTSPHIERSFRSFLGHYHPPRAWVVNKNFQGEIKVDKTTVKFIPCRELFFKEL